MSIARVPSDPAFFEELRGQMVFASIVLVCHSCGDVLPIVKKTGIATEEEAVCAAIEERWQLQNGAWHCPLCVSSVGSVPPWLQDVIERSEGVACTA